MLKNTLKIAYLSSYHTRHFQAFLNLQFYSFCFCKYLIQLYFFHQLSQGGSVTKRPTIYISETKKYFPGVLPGLLPVPRVRVVRARDPRV